MEHRELHDAAQRRWRVRHGDKARIAVQVACCSQAVGAGEVAQVLREAVARNGNAEVVEVGCDGACFLAPRFTVIPATGSGQAARTGEERRYSQVTPAKARAIARGLASGKLPPSDLEPERFFSGQHRRLLERFGRVDPADIDDYILGGGYQGLCNALARTPEQGIEQVLAAGLQGRGGAYFPAALKWRGARSHANVPRYLVVNAEEGEPGIFKDRHIMEAEPQLLLEGLAIACYAAGVERCFIYINAEADLSAQRVERAVEQAYALGVLGDSVLGSGVRVNVEVRRGAGGYVCGDETTLLNTLEGERRVPRLRPPFPTDSGLWGRPTVINNVETICNVPAIMAGGAEAFAAVGADNAKGTKLICLSGAVQHPGLAEVPLGTTLRHIIYEVGGGTLPGHTLSAIACGGPSSGVLPPSMLDTRVRPGQMHPSGVVLGAGGVIVVDERTPVVDVVRKLAQYNADESCGKCTPCREGTPKMAAVLDRLSAGRGKPQDLDELRDLAEVIGAASLCGLGQMSGGPINSALHFFGEEFAKLAGVR